MMILAVSCSWLEDDKADESPTSLPGETPQADIDPPEVTVEPTSDGGAAFTWTPVADATGYEFAFNGAVRSLGDGVCNDQCSIEFDSRIADSLSSTEVLASSTTEQGAGPAASVKTSSFKPILFQREPLKEAPLTVVSVFEAEGPPEAPRVESSIPKATAQRNIKVKSETVETVEEGLALIEKNSRASNIISVEFAGSGLVSSSATFNQTQEESQGIRTQAPAGQLGLDFWPNKGDGVTVAVIDGGVNPNHPGLAEATILPGKNFDTGGDGISQPSDHGTEVASVIVGANPVRGFAPQTAILPVDIYDGEPCCWTPGRLAEAIIWSVDNGADVISISLTVPCLSEIDVPGFSEKKICWGRATVQAAVDYAIKAGVPVVSSTGNSGETGFFEDVANRRDNVGDIPAILRDVITVGSVDPSGNVSDFSTEGSFVDVLAPGEYIQVASGDNQYKFTFGTSFSQPIVASLIAVIRAENPSLTPAEISAAFAFCGAYRERVRPGCVLRRLELPYGTDGPDLAALGSSQELFIQMRIKTSWPGYEDLADKTSTGFTQSFPTAESGFPEFAEDLPGMSTFAEGYFGGEGRGKDEFVYFANVYAEWDKQCFLPWDIVEYVRGKSDRNLLVATVTTSLPVVATGTFDANNRTAQVTISKGIGATDTKAGTLPTPQIAAWNGTGNCLAERELETADVWSQDIVDALESYLQLFPIETTQMQLEPEPSGRLCGETTIDDLFQVKLCGPKRS